ncbi:prephenate dehydrogenase [candidate division KSB1 bacterium]|nr:prephenate dehydrogenase [candidate division KSB1 bacterium]
MGESDIFKRVLIVGTGLIGGSMALALKRKGFKGQLIGCDTPAVLQSAKERNIFNEMYPPNQLKEAARDADLVFLSTPIDVILTLLKQLGECVKPGALVTDMGSTKREIVEMADKVLPKECYFLGGHPMAGSEFRGVEMADPFLFENTTYVLTPARPISETMRKAFGELLEKTGAKVVLMLPKLHDEIAAAVSHLPQILAVTLMNMVAQKQNESPHFVKMAAGGFRDMTRIASSPYGIWDDILKTNSDMISHFIDLFVSNLQDIKKMLAKDEMKALFEQSAAARLSIPKDTKGFLNPNYDLLVAVEDKPGMIAQIANACAENNINIKDIEVLKIRENEGGTIRLAFSSQENRTVARSLLVEKGLECRVR